MNTASPTKDMLGRSSLISVEEARRLLLSNLTAPKVSESIALEEGFNRILAEAVTSGENLPPQPRSVMDGYAVKAADTFGASESMPCYLDITGQVEMGSLPEGSVTKGSCFKIATGGFLPDGADSVVMFEHTVPVDETMIEVVKGVGEGTNVIKTGEDIATDEVAIESGHLLRPQDIGLLAALGEQTISVYPRIRVGILSTGDEIVDHKQKPEPGKIRDINSFALAGMAERCGAIATRYGIVSDTRDVFFAALEKAIAENDIVLFSGGSSVGVRDLGEQAVDAFGPPGILVHGVALKPGKPVLIGMSGEKPVFGLPGHPVSALVCFELFVKPAISRLSGRDTESQIPSTITAKLSRNINSAAGRLDIVRVRITQQNNDIIADPVMGRSGAISTLSRADGYFMIDESSQGTSQGALVEVYPYQ